MLFFQIQAAKIVKGERRDKRKRSFLAWLCRAASYLRKTKLRKECNLLEMSIGQSLIIVIGYELVSYLLHYSSVRCVTFKELFVCKSNNKTGDLEMNLLIFSSHTSFSVKAILSVSTPSPKKILNERVPTAA